MNENEEYDALYDLHRKGEAVCTRSIHDQNKARRRVRQTLRYFKIRFPPKSRALDVGCGLGYFAEALDYAGLSVLGIDFSRIAIDCAREAYPYVKFKCANYPEDINESFDLIWSVGFPTINTFDTRLISDFVTNSLQRLRPNGVLVVGWHTNFSGRMSKENWAHWDLATIRTIRKATGLRGPAIVETRCRLPNLIAIFGCLLLKKSAPIYLLRIAP